MLSFLTRWLPRMPILGRKATHPEVLGAAEHMKRGRIGYEPDPRWSTEAIAERTRELDWRRERILEAERARRAEDHSVRRFPEKRSA